uniref:Uncharacterized protein n=1 Tax=Denticeps clupeoides TaxID=299321 RepID=A0AAY4ATY9_9TELE
MKWTILFGLVCMHAWITAGNDDKLDIEVKEHGDVLMLKCDGGSWTGQQIENPMKLEYKDENSGKYECRHSTTELSKIIHVKFRTGENMIELDTPAVVGICVGNIIATILIGVSVYCIAAQPSQRTFSGSKGRSLPNNKTQFTQSIFIMCLFRRKGQSSDYDQLHIRKK